MPNNDNHYLQNIRVAAHLKWVEHLISVFDKAEDKETLGEIRQKFHQKSGHINQPLLNHLFGFYRLVPLMLFVKDYEGSGVFTVFKENKPEQIKEKINDIRCALAHNDISLDETGFTFENRLKKIW